LLLRGEKHLVDARLRSQFGDVATLAGLPLYKACGYAEIEPVEARTREGVIVPLVRMGKAL
jgi:hypothetical protein